tara:strand:+ start:6778 stop:8433 length:1656 start_codon:yes stop_codon:yes gene_type:complete
MKNVLLVLFLLVNFLINAQEFENGQLSGNFQSDFQLYIEDDALDFNLNNPSSGFPNERGLFNGFANILYRTNNFSSGIRYEAYQNAILGYPSGYQGEDITYRFVQFDKDGLDITLGNFYEQFGSGMILRAYEERNLGYDNAFDGILIKFSPVNGVYLKSLVGRQRVFFHKAEGLIRGIDAEISLNESFSLLSESTTRITMGASFVSKYQADLNTQYVLPENVASWASRMNLNRGKWQFGAEYVYKYNDPSSANNYIFKPGNALLLSGAYSKRGFGISLAAKRIDNMDFRSERDQNLQNAIINYLPALTKQHTYTLATIYPYGTITTGEMGLQTELNYKFKKNSPLGGKYGMGLIANFSNVYAIDKQALNFITPIGSNGTMGYTSDFFKLGEEKYFQEFSIELSRKINSKIKLSGTYINTEYNSSVIVGYKYFGMIYADIFIIESQYKIKPKHTLRSEFQHLKTEQHEGNWAMALVEYTVSPKYFVTVQNMYNYGNNESKLNYPNITLGLNKGTNRVAIGYGKQRAGIFCVGGICRNVPASNGLSLNITSSF